MFPSGQAIGRKAEDGIQTTDDMLGAPARRPASPGASPRLPHRQMSIGFVLRIRGMRFGSVVPPGTRVPPQGVPFGTCGDKTASPKAISSVFTHKLFQRAGFIKEHAENVPDTP
jgi:hypothetical protein